MSKKKPKPKFKVQCPKCKHKFELGTLYELQAGSYECDMCGSHSWWDLTCPKCQYCYSHREV